MSASLVGSEMCIRDSSSFGQLSRVSALPSSEATGAASRDPGAAVRSSSSSSPTTACSGSSAASTGG
eukprot:3456336-Alexandrium_andersonii.AAC.1